MEPKVNIAINAARLAAKEIHKFSRRRDKINVFEKLFCDCREEAMGIS